MMKFAKAGRTRVRHQATVWGLLLACVASLVASAGASAKGWKVEPVPLGSKVLAVVQQDQRTALVQTAKGWKRVALCGAGLCVADSRRPRRARAPSGGLPDGLVARNGQLRAWFSQPTRVYPHGILGDRIEAASLTVRFHGQSAGRTMQISAGEFAVFEDLQPMLADITGNGVDEIIAIRSYLDSGASLVAYKVHNGKLVEAATTRPIGRANRWLNRVGVADFDGDGRREIAFVRTPHIGGSLEIWRFNGKKLKKVTEASGFSNHAIGSRVLDMSAMVDLNGDRRPDMIVPSANRHALRLMTFRNNRLQQLDRLEVNAEIVTNLAVLRGRGKAAIRVLFGLSNGTILSLQKAE